ncbi:MAG: hypothetical protein Q9M20_05320 [Mariprofundaceae bacterium]|nr:hypothetical protein [Mariprofundaceae bacterium]
MTANFEFVSWGMFFAGVMYIIGNGVWVNHLVRERRWLGWVFWILSGVGLLVLAAVFETRLDTASDLGVWQRLTSVDLENHWISLTLFALMSVPGATCVLLKQDVRWTRIALVVPALLIFIPLGKQIANPNDPYTALSLGVALAVTGTILMWQIMLDCEPVTVPKKDSGDEQAA